MVHIPSIGVGFPYAGPGENWMDTTLLSSDAPLLLQSEVQTENILKVGNIMAQ